MPHLERLSLSNSGLKKIGNATAYCRGAACTNLAISVRNSPLPCDKHMCWAKMNTSITLTRDDCLGKKWADVTLADLPCPPGMGVYYRCNNYVEK